MKMEVKAGVRTLEIVTDEAANLNKLIMDREGWLADPINRLRSNYAEVKKDTVDMIFNLKELQDEINYLKK